MPRAGKALQSAAPQSDDVYAAVRANDLARLRTLITSSADANARDEQGDAPLLYAAAVGSLEATKLSWTKVQTSTRRMHSEPRR